MSDPKVCENCTTGAVTDLLTNGVVSNLSLLTIIRHFFTFFSFLTGIWRKSCWQSDILRCQQLFIFPGGNFYHISNLTSHRSGYRKRFLPTVRKTICIKTSYLLRRWSEWTSLQERWIPPMLRCIEPANGLCKIRKAHFPFTLFLLLPCLRWLFARPVL